MKLSKNELNVLLNARMTWHLDSAEFLRSHGVSGKRDYEFYERYGALLNELEDGTLEIEGYERVGWIKFDPNDPKTHPPKNTVVLLAIQGLPLEDNIHTWRSHLQERHNAQGLPGTFTHWRPLPPPIETGVQ